MKLEPAEIALADQLVKLHLKNGLLEKAIECARLRNGKPDLSRSEINLALVAMIDKNLYARQTAILQVSP